jgi:hypothetical protein
MKEKSRNITTILKDGDINERTGGIELDLDGFKGELRNIIRTSDAKNGECGRGGAFERNVHNEEPNSACRRCLELWLLM